MEPAKLPTENTASVALRKLAETDEPHARAKAAVKRLEKAEKIVIASIYVTLEGKIEDRKQRIYQTDQYKQWLDSYEAAVAELALIENRREKYLHHFEFYRSLNANRRMAGNP